MESSRKFHKLTCSSCRRKKAKCDGAYPVCSSCKNIKDSKCLYDKPASISYVRYLERQIEDLQNKLNTKNDNLNSIPFTFISPSLKNAGYFNTILPNHINNLLKINSNDYKLKVSPEELNKLTVKFDITNPKKMSEEIIKHSFPFFLPTRILGFMRNLDNLDLSEINKDSTNLSHALANVILAYSHILNINDTTIDTTELRQKATNLLSQAFFEPPTAVLASACLFHSMMDIFTGGSFQRCWFLSTIASRVIREVSQHNPLQFKRLLWSCYCWDKFISGLLNKQPAFPDPPNFAPSAMGFNLFDIIPYSATDGVSRIDINSSSENIDISPVTIAHCQFSVVLSDILVKNNQFLPIRNKLLEFSDQVYNSLPNSLKPDYCMENNLDFPNEAFNAYSEHLIINLTLLLQLFDPKMQEQLRIQNKNEIDNLDNDDTDDVKNISHESDTEHDEKLTFYNASDKSSSGKSSPQDDESNTSKSAEPSSDSDYLINDKEFSDLITILDKCSKYITMTLNENMKSNCAGLQLVNGWFALLAIQPLTPLFFDTKFLNYIDSKSLIDGKDYFNDFLSLLNRCCASLGEELNFKSPIAKESALNFVNNPPDCLLENRAFIYSIAAIGCSHITNPLYAEAKKEIAAKREKLPPAMKAKPTLFQMAVKPCILTKKGKILTEPLEKDDYLLDLKKISGQEKPVTNVHRIEDSESLTSKNSKIDSLNEFHFSNDYNGSIPSPNELNMTPTSHKIEDRYEKITDFSSDTNNSISINVDEFSNNDYLNLNSQNLELSNLSNANPNFLGVKSDENFDDYFIPPQNLKDDYGDSINLLNNANFQQLFNFDFQNNAMKNIDYSGQIPNQGQFNNQYGQLNQNYQQQIPQMQNQQVSIPQQIQQFPNQNGYGQNQYYNQFNNTASLNNLTLNDYPAVTQMNQVPGYVQQQNYRNYQNQQQPVINQVPGQLPEPMIQPMGNQQFQNNFYNPYSYNRN